tara:strand:+ start:4194 stop:5156 length:963 start_codon:yes stop_codon:yes gene_type:complete
MKILITGTSGFIGYHLAKSYLEDGHSICGIDNMNNYYDKNLKISRLERLLAHKKFEFNEANLIDINSLGKIFDKFKPQKVVNLAAQAGVRYSIKNPKAYLDSNLIGFMNVLESSRKHEVEGLIYASSSSIYGGNSKIPFDVTDKTDNPISLYAATKKSNELLANAYHNIYNMNVTGLRFFTVYGPWGRPDMAYFSFTKNILEGKSINVFNKGKMKRDFTYIDDIISGTKAAVKRNYPCEIFNLGNSESIELMEFISILEKNIGKKAKISFLPMQNGDVKATYANISHSTKMLNYKPETKIHKGLKSFVAWYQSYFSDKVI